MVDDEEVERDLIVIEPRTELLGNGGEDGGEVGPAAVSVGELSGLAKLRVMSKAPERPVLSTTRVAECAGKGSMEITGSAYAFREERGGWRGGVFGRMQFATAFGGDERTAGDLASLKVRLQVEALHKRGFADKVRAVYK